ncbi:MAG: CRTAC1 family protein [Solirubrobacterales bacterium]
MAACAAVGLGAWTASAASAQGEANFEPREIDIATRLIFDLGVVDFDRDSDLDVFTTNHNDREVLLANQGGGVFEDRLSAVDLDQSPDFPGLEIPLAPPMGEDGVYVFRTPGNDAAEGALRVVVEADPGEEVSGRIEFLFPVEVNRDEGADVSKDFDTSQSPARHVVNFTSQGDALIELEPEQMAAPIEVDIEQAHPLAAIFVGAFGVRPPAHRFTLQLRDRHGMAWADYNRDGRMDVFIVRGGLKRRVGEFGGLITDELMLGDGSTFHDAIGASSLLKGACRARETSPVDFNRDGLLDLFWGCQAATPALYRQNEDGTFTNRSGALARAEIGGDHFRWLDVNGNGRDELIASRNHRLVVYKRSRKGRWSKRDAFQTGGEAPGRVAVADYDSDGDPDLFAASPTGNKLVVNRDGHLRARSPGRLGLPKLHSFAASWVDYDNDGRADLYAAPQGIFRRTSGGRFKRTGLASSPAGTLDALATWFDFNADGARDLLLARADSRGWSASVLENGDHENHWLALELTGPDGAYPAAAARVRVRTEERAQTQWVGQSDDSRYSQGHYRLYFGLGDSGEARAVNVRWPDGASSKLEDVNADRLVHVRFDDRKSG